MARPRKPQSESLSFKQQFSALRNLPPFFRLIWETSKSMALGNIILRTVNSAIPLAMLYIGKEIIDAIIALQNGEAADQKYLWLMLGLELGLAVISTLINRGISLLDSLLGDLVSNRTSVDLIRHAARLDLYQFENAEFYDKLERARRQTTVSGAFPIPGRDQYCFSRRGLGSVQSMADPLALFGRDPLLPGRISF